MSLKRKTTIDLILEDLKNLRIDPSFNNVYAVDANIAFFKAIRSLPKFVFWLLTKAPKLDPSRLLELSDLPLPRWDVEMHRGLIKMEKRKFPGLVEPLVNRIVDIISESNRNFTIMSVGHGGMEVERQVIEKLSSAGFPHKVTIWGIDKSRIIKDIAFNNLEDLNSITEVKEITQLNNRLMSKNHKQFEVLLYNGDVLNVVDAFKSGYFDLAYHSLFKHHITKKHLSKIDSGIMRLSKRILEYDGYKTWLVFIPQTLTTWKLPVLFNATIFSNLRYQSKSDIIKAHPKEPLSFFKIGTYILEKKF